MRQIDAAAGGAEFRYDPSGNRTDLVDPVGNNTHWQYDGLNRAVSETQQDAYQGTDLASGSFQYDAAGLLLRAIDRNGRVIDYAYDAAGRRTRERWYADEASAPAAPDAAPASPPLRTFVSRYDAAGRLLSVTDREGEAPAEPDWGAGSLSAVAYTYDRFDRLVSTTNRQADRPDVTLTQTYDDRGRIAAVAVQIGQTADFTNSYTYDDYGRLVSLVQTGVAGGSAVADKRVDFGYNEFGQPANITRYADEGGTQMVSTSTYSYDAVGRLTGLVHAGPTATQAEYEWLFDAAGRPTAFNNLLHTDESATYSYDDTNQLTGADRDGTNADESYTYDAAGNRDYGGYVTDVHNRMIADGTYAYTYDAEGNRATRTKLSDGSITRYVWDHRNRLVETTEEDDQGTVTQRVTYQYDALNQRLARTADLDGAGSGEAVEVRYVWHADNVVLTFTDGDLSNRYLQGPEMDRTLADERPDGTVYWALADHLGTVRDVVDSAGAVVTHRTYDSFGRITGETDPTLGYAYAFTGALLDRETGLQHHRARYYDPAHGRWISEDPIGFGTHLRNFRPRLPVENGKPAFSTP